MTLDRTAAAIEARRRAAEQKLQQVRDAIATLRRRKTPVTYPAVARQAGVSAPSSTPIPMPGRWSETPSARPAPSTPGAATIRSRPGGNARSTPRRR